MISAGFYTTPLQQWRPCDIFISPLRMDRNGLKALKACWRMSLMAAISVQFWVLFVGEDMGLNIHLPSAFLGKIFGKNHLLKWGMLIGFYVTIYKWGKWWINDVILVFHLRNFEVIPKMHRTKGWNSKTPGWTWTQDVKACFKHRLEYSVNNGHWVEGVKHVLLDHNVHNAYSSSMCWPFHFAQSESINDFAIS